MFCSKILVSYDGSEPAKKSLEKAMEIALIDKSIAIHIIHIALIPALPIAGSISGLEDSIFTSGNEIIAELKEKIAGIPNPVELFFLKGLSIPDIILNHADEQQCDLIIMGSRGLTGIKEFLGSVSAVVVPRAKMPVLIVK